MVISSFEDAILNSSNVFKKLKRYGGKPRNYKPWFDTDCKRAKTDARKRLNRFRLSRSEHDLLLYVNSKHAYKNICKRKKFVFDKNALSKLESTTGNSKRFWGEVKKLTNKPRTEPNISLDDWFNHFSNLFSVVNNVDSENEERINAENENDDFDDIEQLIFNSRNK